MADDSRVPPLTKRAPGESGMRRPDAQRSGVVLPESVVRRVRAALETSREQDPDFQKVAPVQAVLALPEPGDLLEAAGLPEAPRLPKPRGLPESHDLPEAPKAPVAPKVPDAPKVQDAPKVSDAPK